MHVYPETATAGRGGWCVRGNESKRLGGWHVQLTKFSKGALLGVIQLGALDDDDVGGQVDPLGQGGRAAQHLDEALSKEALHQVALRP